MVFRKRASSELTSLVVCGCNGVVVNNGKFLLDITGKKEDKLVGPKEIKFLEGKSMERIYDIVDNMRGYCKIHPHLENPALIDNGNTENLEIYIITDMPFPLPQYLLREIIDSRKIHSTSVLMTSRGYVTETMSEGRVTGIANPYTKGKIASDIIEYHKKPIGKIFYYQVGRENDLKLGDYLEAESGILRAEYLPVKVTPDQFANSCTVSEAAARPRRLA